MSAHSLSKTNNPTKSINANPIVLKKTQLKIVITYFAIKIKILVNYFEFTACRVVIFALRTTHKTNTYCRLCFFKSAKPISSLITDSVGHRPNANIVGRHNGQYLCAQLIHGLAAHTHTHTKNRRRRKISITKLNWLRKVHTQSFKCI